MNVASPEPVADAQIANEGPPAGSSTTRPSRDLLNRLSGATYVVVAAVSVAVVFLGQLAEDLADSPPLQMMPPVALIQRWSVVALVLYALAMWAFLDSTVRRSLRVVRHVVEVDDATFDRHVARMRAPSVIVDLVVLIAVVILDIALFVFLDADLLLDDPITRQPTKLPGDPASALLIIGGYVVISWTFIRLGYFCARLARELGQLSRQPLLINVFDTTDLLPFGNIALAVALAPAGVLVILLVGLGAPTTAIGWGTVAIATLVIVLALILPLRGIHSQMSRSKDEALDRLGTRLTELYQLTSAQLINDSVEVGRLGAAAGILIPLRKTVQEMTTWPFRDTVAFGRAVLIASAPLIYTTLSELIRVFIIGPISP